MDFVPVSVGQINQNRHWNGILIEKFAKSREDGNEGWTLLRDNGSLAFLQDIELTALCSRLA